jgi:4-amino-4-deoxy-L-arabinose transferase-like glycosyltransferase
MRRDVRASRDPWLWLILAAGLALRLLYFTEPYADAHRWRQLENLAVAWNFERGSLNPFYPEAIWGGLRSAYVEMEFPLVPYVLALAWRLFGVHEAFGRVIGIASSLVLIAAMYLLGRQLFSRAVGRGAALLLAVSPSAVFFGRVPMTDTPMIACSTLAVLGYVRYFETGSRAWAIGAAIAAAGAWLLKIPALLILGPIMAVAWQTRGWRLISDRLFIAGLVLAFLVTAAWYWHALRLYEQTGWTVGIWHQAGQHPPAIAASTGPPSTFSLWSTRELLKNPAFYERLLDRAWSIHLTPLGLAGALFGLIRAAQVRHGVIALTWLLAACSFVIVAGAGNWWHEYYQLPLLPPAALLFGLGAATVFGSREEQAVGADHTVVVASADPAPRAEHLSRSGWGSWIEWIGRPLIIMALAVASFHYSGIVRNFFRPDTRDDHVLQAGKAIASHIPPNDGVIVVEYEQGTNSPVLLYMMRRRGWSFDMQTISPHVIEHLKREGATYFATTTFLLLENRRPDVAEYLRMTREIPLGDRAPEEIKLFELQ